MPSLIDLAFPKIKPQKTIDTSGNVRPDKPKGYLVNTPLYKVPFEYVEDLAKDTYSVAKGLNGNANDHELGKQNDLAMKIGGLAIAGYLYTIRPSNLPKLMEFIGLGSFFASMSLWPKLAIALPLKMRTGVDIQQKYIDSYGRKKNFFQDPQYIPWDLFSKEQIKKIGDKMGVPYDVPNRDEVITDKARKMAVQGNTLWLATAGFATPIMASLICDGLTPFVGNIKQSYLVNKAKKIYNSPALLNSSVKAPKEMQKRFNEYIAQNMGKEIKETETLSKLIMNEDYFIAEPDLRSHLKSDLDKIFKGKTLNEENGLKIKAIFDEMNIHLNRKKLLDKYSETLFGEGDDSLISNNWKKFKKTLLSELELNKEELEFFTQSDFAKQEKLLINKFSQIAADPVKYEKTIYKLSLQLAKIDTEFSSEERSKYRATVVDLYTSAKKRLQKLGLESTAGNIGGRGALENLKPGSSEYLSAVDGTVIQLKHDLYDRSVFRLKTSVYRMIQALDYQARLKNGLLEAQVKQFKSLEKNFDRYNFNILKKCAQDYIMNASEEKISNYPSTYKGAMRMLYGALPEDFVKDTIINTSGDIKVRAKIMKAFEKDGIEGAYKEAINAGFDKIKLNRERTGLCEETIKALYDASKKIGNKKGKNIDLVDNFKIYCQTFIDKIVNANGAEYSLVKEHNVKGGLTDIRDSGILISDKPLNVIKSAVKDAFDHRKWLKPYGIAGIILLAGTVLATTFFGYMPKSEMYINNGKKK